MDKINLTAETARLIQLVLDGEYKLKDGVLIPSRRSLRAARKAMKDARLSLIEDFYISWVDDIQSVLDQDYDKEKVAYLGSVSAFKMFGTLVSYFSVKTTSSSNGLLPAVLKAHPEITRQDVLDFLSREVAEGRLEKVGLKGGVEIPVEEANNFQIRYRLPIYTTPPDDEKEVVLETNGDMTLEDAFKALEVKDDD